MEKLNVTTEQMTDAMRAVVAERGRDYVYRMDRRPACLYVHVAADGGQSPGCLAGAALNKLGVPLTELQQHEGWGASWVAKVFTTLDESTRVALSKAQDRQDASDPWGACLDDYLTRIGSPAGE